MNHAPDLVPDPIRALWQEAARFIAFVLHQFSREHIRAGIRRATGARLSIWLSEAESALRRLIFIAALSLTPAPLKQRRSGTPTPRTTDATTRSFRIFSLHGSGVARASRWMPPREPQPYAHIRFPSDPILALGRIPTRSPTHRHNGGPILPRPKQRHPLDRWVRLSRTDPDWRPSPNDGVFVDLDYTIVHEPPDEDAPKRKRRKKPLRLDSQADWRRHHDEWQKLVPAPILAARLDALERAMAKPEALIQRTARRLQSQRERTLTLARAAAPSATIPRRARHIDAGERTLAPAAHKAFPACDSS
jgi:hypothetical protein